MEQTLFAGSANARLAEAIATELGTSQGALNIDRFPDGELHVEIKQSVRGHDVYLIQSTSPPVERTCSNSSCWPMPPTGPERHG
jgi:ribose-phosphate pyrophosphokinase